VSGIRPAGGAAKATVDAFSHASGQGDPVSVAGSGAGTEPLPYVEVNRSWGPAPSIPAENRLTLTLTDVASVHLDADRAGLSTRAPIRLSVTATADGVVHLVSGRRVLDVPVAAGTSDLVVRF
jgi:hypothetical protein